MRMVLQWLRWIESGGRELGKCTRLDLYSFLVMSI